MAKKKQKYEEVDWVDLKRLVEELESAKEAIEQLPDDYPYSKDHLEVLEDLRWKGLRLAEECEASIKTFEGKVGEDDDHQ